MAAVMNILIVMLVVSSVFLSPLPAKAAPAHAPSSSCYELWSFTVTVSDNNGNSKDLVIGQGIFASSGTDPCDVIWPPPPQPGDFDARIKGSGITDYATDYRLANLPGLIDWDLNYVPETGGSPITLTWNPADLPGAGTVALVDVFTGGLAFYMDMSSGGSFDTSTNPFTVSSVRIRYDTTGSNRCLITAVASGNWNSDSTWNGNCSSGVPASTYDVFIPDGFDVTLDAGVNPTVESLTLEGAGSLGFASGNDLVVSDNGFMRGGSLDMGNGNLYVNGEFYNAGTLSQTKNVGTSGPVSFLQITPLGGGADRYHGMDINASSDLGATTVQIKGNASVCNNAPNGGEYRDRCFMANPTNSGDNTLVTLYSTPGEDDISNDAFFQYGGTDWNQVGTCQDVVGGTCSALVNFSSPEYFLIGCGDNDPTAVELSSFSASNDPGSLLIILVGATIILLVGTLALKRLPER